MKSIVHKMFDSILMLNASMLRSDSENKGSGEGESRAIYRVLEGYRVWIEGVTRFLHGFIG